MLWKRRRARFAYLPEQSVIRLAPGWKGMVDHVDVRPNGDLIWYRGGSRTHYLTFEIADYDAGSDSRKHGLPSADRLRGFDDKALQALARITAIPLDELKEIRELERSAQVDRPTWQ
jgi:hypothetical protein